MKLHPQSAGLKRFWVISNVRFNRASKTTNGCWRLLNPTAQITHWCLWRNKMTIKICKRNFKKVDKTKSSPRFSRVLTWNSTKLWVQLRKLKKKCLKLAALLKERIARMKKSSLKSYLISLNRKHQQRVLVLLNHQIKHKKLQAKTH